MDDFSEFRSMLYRGIFALSCTKKTRKHCVLNGSSSSSDSSSIGDGGSRGNSIGSTNKYSSHQDAKHIVETVLLHNLLLMCIDSSWNDETRVLDVPAVSLNKSIDAMRSIKNTYADELKVRDSYITRQQH